MNFLKTAFWVIIAVILALFTKANWFVAPSAAGYIPIKLWGDIIVETRLPILILAAFLLGLLPTWLWARATKWQMKRKLNSAERALASSIALQQQTIPASDLPATESSLLLSPDDKGAA